MSLITIYNSGLSQLATLDSASVKIMLLSDSYTPNKDHATTASLTGQMTGGGYVAGGLAVTGITVTEDLVNDLLTIDQADLTFTNLIGNFRYAVAYNTADNSLIYVLDYETAVVFTSDNWTIAPRPEGLFTIQQSAIPTGFDIAVKVSSSDTTADYLINKLSNTGNVTFAIVGGGGNESVKGTVDLSSFLTDAPSDGEEYVRKDGTWSIVSASPQTPWTSTIDADENDLERLGSLRFGATNTYNLYYFTDANDQSGLQLFDNDESRTAILYATSRANGDLVSAGDALVSDGSGNYYATPISVSSVWGAITGTLTDQTDLVAELATYAKLDSSNQPFVAGGFSSLNTSTRILVDAGGIDSLDWNSRTLKYNSGVTAIDYLTGYCQDTGGAVSFDFSSQGLRGTRLVLGGGADDGTNDLQLNGSSSLILSQELRIGYYFGLFNFGNIADGASAYCNFWTREDEVTPLATGDVWTYNAATNKWAGAQITLSDYAKLDGSNQPFTGNLNISKVTPRFTITDTADTATSYIEKLATNNKSRLVSQNRLYLAANGLSLNGSGYASRAVVTIGTIWSLDCWYKTSSTASQMIASGNNTASILLWFSSATQITVRTAAGTFGIWTVSYADGLWHHWAVTMNGNTVELFRDSVSQGAQNTGGNSSHTFTNIGNYGVDTNHKCVGVIDELVLWDIALSQAQVNARYNSGAGAELSSYTNVIAEYKLNSTYTDSSPNGYTVTAQGSGNSFVTGQVSSSAQAVSDLEYLSVVNNSTDLSLGTVTLGAYSGTYGTKNIFEGTDYRFNVLGVSKLTYDGTDFLLTGNINASGKISGGAVNTTPYAQIQATGTSGANCKIGFAYSNTYGQTYFTADFSSGSQNSNTLAGYINQIGGTGNQWINVLGNLTVQFYNNVTTSGTITTGNGTAGTPSHSFASRSTNGMFSPAANTVAISTNGSQVFTLDATSISSGGATITSHTWNVSNFGLLSLSASQLKAGTDGTSANPFFSWSSATGLGMYRVSGNILGFATAGILRLQVSATGTIGVNLATAPTELLDVRSPGSTDGFIRVAYNGTGSRFSGFKWGGDAANYGLLDFGASSNNVRLFQTYTAGDLLFGTNTTENARITGGGAGNFGVGTGATVSARIHAISTTEQLRLGYDASNYFSTTVSSAGAVTFNAVGGSAGFIFSDYVDATSYKVAGVAGASGTFTTVDLKTVTVTNGLITSIV